MLIEKSCALAPTVPTPISSIEVGTVFSGSVQFDPYSAVTGFFLKLSGHIVNLDTNALYGAGINSNKGTVSVLNFKAHPNSVLTIR